MATVTRTTVWVDNQVLTAAALNGEFNNLLNALALTDSDIASNAGIQPSKINGTAATLSTTQTLTNKTLGTGTIVSLGSDAQGDIYYNNGSVLARLGAGTAGQFLRSGGASANPLWDNVSVDFVTGVSSDITTSSSSYATMTDLSVSHTTKTGRVMVFLTASLYNNTTSVTMNLALKKDSDAEVGATTFTGNASTANYGTMQTTFYYWTGLTIGGSNTFAARWKTSGGTATSQSTSRYMLVVDV